MARSLARFEMEKINNMPYASIDSANSPNYEGYNYALNRTVSFAQGGAGSPESLKKIIVSVKKTVSSAELISLVTYLASNVSYGI